MIIIMFNKLFRILVLLSIVLFHDAVSAQNSTNVSDRPNFSGRWKYIPEKSDPFPDQWLEITHDGIKLTIIPKFPTADPNFEFKVILISDGSGEQNEIPFEQSSGKITKLLIESRSRWKGRTIVRSFESKSSYVPSGRTVQEFRDETETYSLSKDGNTLTIESISTLRRSSVSQSPRSSEPSRNIRKRSFRKV